MLKFICSLPLFPIDQNEINIFKLSFGTQHTTYDIRHTTAFPSLEFQSDFNQHLKWKYFQLHQIYFRTMVNDGLRECFTI